ncbi:MAG: gephyrin-like molybdotransferase Glp [Leeuwenhoekiella sp.]
MISVSEALSIIDQSVVHSEVVAVSLQEAQGCILVEDVYAPIHMPPFRQSAMDGYAIKWSEQKDYEVIGEIQAGSVSETAIDTSQAIRIFTGAPVPESADTVIIQEHVTRNGNIITIDQLPKKGANIRPIGEQVEQGKQVLKKGLQLNEAAIGFLAGLGLTEVKVYKKPSVTIVTTGDELQPAGEPLKPGCIYESNGLMLQMALRRLGVLDVKIYKAKDDLQATQEVLEIAIQESDVILISGGISIGDYDFVKEALEYNEVGELFYKVNQKPGKPLWFGKKEEKLVFALPGNPGSSLTAFYVYVLPALRKIMGHTQNHLVTKTATLSEEIKNPVGKTLFMKAQLIDDQLVPLTGQASSMLNSLAIANALLIVPGTISAYKQNDQVTYLDLNF